MASAQEVLDICESLEGIEEVLYRNLQEVKSVDIFKKFLNSVGTKYQVFKRKDIAGRTVFTSPKVAGVIARIGKGVMEINRDLLTQI